MQLSIFTNFLDSLAIPYRLEEHAPVFTVSESQQHKPDAYPVKNLLLKEEKGERLIFVIMKGDERLDTKRVAQELGAKKLQFAKPDILMQTLGVEPGSASVLSLLHEGSMEVEVVIEKRLIDQPELGFHPNDNTKTLYIDGKHIEQILRATEHRYILLENTRE